MVSDMNLTLSISKKNSTSSREDDEFRPDANNVNICLRAKPCIPNQTDRNREGQRGFHWGIPRHRQAKVRRSGNTVCNRCDIVKKQNHSLVVFALLHQRLSVAVARPGLNNSVVSFPHFMLRASPKISKMLPDMLQALVRRSRGQVRQ